MGEWTTRRTFLRMSSGLGASLVLPACSAGSESDSAAGDSAQPTTPLTVSKVPWVSLQGAGTARLRFETREDDVATVTVLLGTDAVSSTPSRSATELSYSWADDEDLEDIGVIADKPGTHVIQDVIITDLPADTEVVWTVDVGGGVRHEGSFRTDPGPDGSFVLGWLSDTMVPKEQEVIDVLAGLGADVVIHGGDIQYQTNVMDTWSGVFASMGVLTAQATCHFVVGNHEFETQDEIEVMYDRLMLGQGDSERRYFAFRYGGVHLLCLDTESGGLESADGGQYQWLEAQLDAASADADVRHIVVCMHRPFFTFTRHWPEDPIVREMVHPLLVKHGVQLVLAGHSHCYERFLVDGIHYVVDGGGGGLLYNPDQNVEAARKLRPEEVDLRVAVSATYGACQVRFSPGGIHVERWSVDGELVEAIDI